ncbi:MAG: efflux RND transporter periplasmic adaptor subunit [Treponema sp.]|jgi:multidrug efflux pump subunit AcrA (membrane-fusion protein)|nr:efflux RND transporter periplasmic adaptor subunit [Treponema sp.]
MKTSKIITAVIVLLAAIFALLIGYNYLPPKYKFQNKAPTQGEGAQGERQGGRPAAGGGQGGARGTSRSATVVRVTEVAPGTIEKSIIINGDVLARNQVSIFPTVGGKLTDARLAIGDSVNRGDVVAMVDPSRPGEVYSGSPVISTVSGTVIQAPFSIGDTLTTQSAVYVVGDLMSLRVETFIPERYVAVIRQGLNAVVWLEAIPGETFNAEVVEINPVLDPASRTMRIRLEFTGRAARDPRIKAGMFATVSLVTSRKVNVPVIPRMSVINTYGSWIVFIVDENNIARRREVELGLDNEEFLEVLRGVSRGDRVVSQGQNFLSDGDPVRIVE